MLIFKIDSHYSKLKTFLKSHKESLSNRLSRSIPHARTPDDYFLELPFKGGLEKDWEKLYTSCFDSTEKTTNSTSPLEISSSRELASVYASATK